ncbi:hypothetical protein NL676_002097 [Syzygium grande]|nr:hypothetical protein NL676_002097 [Syzygium grande]
MVGRSVATNLRKFAPTVEAVHLKTDILSIFEDLTQDDQDSVRLLAVEGCAALGKLLGPQDAGAHILPVMVNFSHDKSWRVRYTVAHELYELCEAVGPEPTRSDLVPAYVCLLRDNEAEVRIAAAGKVTWLCRILNPELAIQQILPCVKELSTDSSQRVRSALASVIMGMAPVLGNVVIGIDLLSQSLLPSIVELAEDRHWRVYSIRDAAANNVRRLAEEFGPEWAMEHIVPQALDMISNPHSLYRMTVLHVISLLAPVMGSDLTCSKLLPVVISSSKDRVPNIRFNAAKVLQSIIPLVGPSNRAVGVPRRRRRRRSDEEVRSFSDVVDEVRKSASSQQASTVFLRRPLISSSCESFQFSISTSCVGEEYVNEE